MTGVIPPILQKTNPYRTKSATSLSPQMTVFCDFDGPIMDVSERYYSTYELGLSETKAIYEARGICLPIQALTKSQFWQLKQDRVPDVDIAMRSGLYQEQIDVFLGRVTQIVNQPELLQKDHLQPGSRWAIAWLYAHGVQLVLVTLRCQQQARQILEDYGLAHLFKGIYGTQDEKAAYQNQAELKTELLADAIRAHSGRRWRLGSAWMVGDTEADILAGQRLSIPTVALTCGIRSEFYLKRFQPTHIYSDLFSAAQHLVAFAKVR